MPKSKTCLTDVNTWLALAAPGHVHHLTARRWFESLGEGEAVFCRITQMGLLRLLTQASVMKTDVLSPEQAWRLYRQLRRDWRVAFAAEPAGLESVWIELMSTVPSGSRTWTDAYLAAFAIECSYMMATFDRGFEKWKSLSLRLLG
jgi:toxin-antitoxin system PIN domain toxin